LELVSLSTTVLSPTNDAFTLSVLLEIYHFNISLSVYIT